MSVNDELRQKYSSDIVDVVEAAEKKINQDINDAYRQGEHFAVVEISSLGIPQEKGDDFRKLVITLLIKIFEETHTVTISDTRLTFR